MAVKRSFHYDGRTSDSTSLKNLAAGAEYISVNVGRERRVEMNRIRKATGLSLMGQAHAALDLWFEHRKQAVAEAGLAGAPGSSGITSASQPVGERAGEQKPTPVLASSTLDQLKGYVQHKPSCPQSIRVRFKPEPGWVTGSYVKPCNCGLDALLSGSGQ